MVDLTPQERRQARTRDAILDAAEAEIKEKGFEHHSLRGVARRIDYSPAGLYEYFESKEALVGALCLRVNEQLSAYLNAVPAGLPYTDYMQQLLQAYIQHAVDHPELFTMMFHNMRIGVEETPDEIVPEDAFAILMGVVERGIAEGEIEVAEGFGTFEIAYSLWTLAHGMATLRINYMRDFQMDFDEVNAQAMRLFLRGLKGA